jgi:hypothetical protein
MSTASSTPAPKSTRDIIVRFPQSEKNSSASSTANAPTPPPAPASIAVPMGFAGQLKALHAAQLTHEARISALEKENTELKASHQDLLARVTIIEQENAALAAARRETVSQLLNLRTLHQEADNTFHQRSQDIQPDDLERMIGVYANAVTTVLSHHQRVLWQVRANGQMSTYAPATYSQQTRSPFPVAYNEAGYCHAHGVPYWCRTCGQ